ncbi:hypothetical protein J4446_00230 [Candidatus Woesearchaeota archaeon]|nr:hypothetical protein [Candidatus Woesearchaeota archaeon]
MLKIPERQKNPKKSNQDIYDAVNQDNIKPAAGPTPDPLDELDQFEMPSSDEKSSIPEPPSRYEMADESPKQSYNMPNYSAPLSRPNVQSPEVSTDYIQQIAEEVVEEKWDDLMNKVGDIRLWKNKIDSDITSIKQEIMRTQNHFANLQKAVLGKVSEYNENILNINTEMKSLEKVFEKILQPLTHNVKELSKITDKLKTKKV